jgi:murein L,D-transpeptidase YafK
MRADRRYTHTTIHTSARGSILRGLCNIFGGCDKKKDSAFYKAIHISYPNAEDRQRARGAGVSPGGFIMIHGQKNGWGGLAWITQRFNWTDGCIAVTNSDMDEIWDRVDVGTPIEIKP